MTDRTRLLGLLKDQGFRKGTFTLASGKESDFYIDVRSVALSAEGHWLFGRLLFIEAMALQLQVDAVAGVELGGCPLVSAVAQESFARRDLPSVPAIYVRKKPKSHGTKKLVEAPHGVLAGSQVVLVEDVVTSGGSSLRAIQSLMEAGFLVTALIVVVDRKEGGMEAIQEAHPELVVASLFTRYDFIPEAV